ncbi:hypothetical protein BC831DRAFT_552785 [Entophlyctis helioformis]|nr:hypothetical protein BC831DRAFT_552785 [Entophlyctis helioformis]
MPHVATGVTGVATGNAGSGAALFSFTRMALLVTGVVSGLLILRLTAAAARSAQRRGGGRGRGKGGRGARDALGGLDDVDLELLGSSQLLMRQLSSGSGTRRRARRSLRRQASTASTASSASALSASALGFNADADADAAAAAAAIDAASAFGDGTEAGDDELADAAANEPAASVPSGLALASTSGDGFDEQADESKHLLQLLYSIAEDQARKEGYVHRSITCNHCSTSPVRGYRFKCANCVDFDLCELCEAMDVHIKTHVFIKIRIPLPPLANPHVVLFQPLYPGDDFVSGQHHYDFEQLQVDTHFDEIELGAFYDQFRSLSTVEGPDGGIDRATFVKCLGPLGFEKNLISDRIFAFFDQDRDNVISFRELVCGLSILCRGSLDERILYAFQGYDLDGDGCISRDELRRMFKAYFNLSMELVRDVVKTMEEGMMESFDDEAAKPVSASFLAPIPAGDGPDMSSDSDANGDHDDDDASGRHRHRQISDEDGDDGDDDRESFEGDFGPPQDTVMTNGIRRNRPRAAGTRRTKPRKIVENVDDTPESPLAPMDLPSAPPMAETASGSSTSTTMTVTAATAHTAHLHPSHMAPARNQSSGSATSTGSPTSASIPTRYATSATSAASVSASVAPDALPPRPIISTARGRQSPTDMTTTANATASTPTATVSPGGAQSTTRIISGIVRRTSQPVLRNSLTADEVTSATTASPIREAANQIRQRTIQSRRSVSFDVQPLAGAVTVASSPASYMTQPASASSGGSWPTPTTATATSMPAGTPASGATSLIDQEQYPILEAMSQEAIEEMVDRAFAMVDAADRDRLTFEEFKVVVAMDVNVLAWFEALGSVF